MAQQVKQVVRENEDYSITKAWNAMQVQVHSNKKSLHWTVEISAEMYAYQKGTNLGIWNLNRNF